jgi:hypothetical protein
LLEHLRGEPIMAEEIPGQEGIDPDQPAMGLEEGMHEVGWVIQNRNEMNLDAAQGVAVRDFPGVSVKRDLDYLLFVNGRAVGVTWKARPLLDLGERELLDASAVRRANSFPVPFSPLPFIVFEGQPPMPREWPDGYFRVMRITGLTRKESYQDRFPSPSTLSHLMTREKIFLRLGGGGLRWLIRYAFRFRAGQFEVTSIDRERAAKLRR